MHIDPNGEVGFELANGDEGPTKERLILPIPSREVRETLAVDDLVKLLFLIDPEARNRVNDLPAGERMWVRVTSLEQGRYRGVLDNDPSAITTIKAGDEILFGPENVVATESWIATSRIGEFDEDPDLGVFVTRPVWDRHEPIREVVHDSDGDWLFLCGTTEAQDDVILVCLADMGGISRS
jgi:hypothetical protein